MEGLPRPAVAHRHDRGGILSGRRVVFWRHGQTIWNVEHRFQGRTDIPLDETGRTQAKTAARLLSGMRPDAIVSSDLCRARDTAAELAAITGLSVSTDPRLQERSGGEWEGLTGDEIRARYPAEWAVWEPVGGEADADVGKRVMAAVDEALADLPDGGTLVVASHGGAIRSGLAVLLGLPAALWGRLGPLSNCAWSLVGEAPAGWRTTGWRLMEHNAGTLPEPVLSDDR